MALTKLTKTKQILLFCIFAAGAILMLTFAAPKQTYANPSTGKEGELNCRVYAAVDMTVTSTAGGSTKVVKVTAGQRMTVYSIALSNGTKYYRVTLTKNGKTYRGYVKRSKCLINLADYDPDIIVYISNVSYSLYKTQGTNSSGSTVYTASSISGLTGKALYGDDNPDGEDSDWESDEAPVTLAFAQKLADANDLANADGYTIRVYDAYRPAGVSSLMNTKVTSAYNNSSKVRYSMTLYGFSQSWFVASSLSAHNTATAVDCTLVKTSTKKALSMPTSMHVLSATAAVRSAGSPSKTNSTLTSISVGAGTSTQKSNAIKLNNYMTKAGLYSLRSEWWHFQYASDNGSTGYGWYIHE